MGQKAVARRKKGAKGEVVRRSIAVTIKGSEAWKDWLEEAATHCRMSVASFLDISAAHYAKTQGFDKPPPER